MWRRKRMEEKVETDKDDEEEKVEKEEEDDVSESLPPITCACTV